MKKTCLFCRNTRIFDIHKDFGNNSHTAKNDMLEFFGHQIESFLRPDDAICNTCMNIMDNVAKLKRRLLPLIFRSEPSNMEEDSKPLNFGKKWDIFASMNFDDENDPFLNSRSPTPSSLLTCKRIDIYESPLEMKIAEIERYRSLSRTSARSAADSEIVKAFTKKRGRRRKRGHNWSKRKNGRYSRTDAVTRRSVMSVYSTRSAVASRPVSSLSNLSTDSYESFYPPGMQPSTSAPAQEKKRVRHADENVEIKPKSVAKPQVKEIDLQEDELHECCMEGCTFICKDIDFMVQHKMTRHKQLALFRCNYCGKKYTSDADLEIHKRTHAEQYSCVICHKEFYFDRDLVQHWQEEHVKKSVPCPSCGKRFVDQNICNKHQKNVHKRNIPSRTDYNKENKNKEKEQSNSPNRDFEVRMLVQSSCSIPEILNAKEKSLQVSCSTTAMKLQETSIEHKYKFTGVPILTGFKV
ncbi:zinc finger and BTB domain-containing protein 24 [Tribolium castaneum]|uniref:zinc finger and BTB domain-containing protein 24 n=1 Tax=Tribolium castaneum TaxID=7070 RepID=UPI0030FE5D87